MIETDYLKVVEKLKADFKVKRCKYRMSLREVDKLCGVSYSTLARFENGKGEPSLIVLKQIGDWVYRDKGSPSIERIKKPTPYQSLSERIERIEKHLGFPGK